MQSRHISSKLWSTSTVSLHDLALPSGPHTVSLDVLQDGLRQARFRNSSLPSCLPTHARCWSGGSLTSSWYPRMNRQRSMSHGDSVTLTLHQVAVWLSQIRVENG